MRSAKHYFPVEHMISKTWFNVVTRECLIDPSDTCLGNSIELSNRCLKIWIDLSDTCLKIFNINPASRHLSPLPWTSERNNMSHWIQQTRYSSMSLDVIIWCAYCNAITRESCNNEIILFLYSIDKMTSLKARDFNHAYSIYIRRYSIIIYANHDMCLRLRTYITSWYIDIVSLA